MRIYRPQNEVGEKLLSAGELTNSSVLLTKKLIGGKVVLTSDDVPEIERWSVKNVIVVVNNEAIAFTPSVKFNGTDITLMFANEDSDRELDFESVRINLQYQSGMDVFSSNIEADVPEEEQESLQIMVEEVIKMGTKDEITALGKQLAATGKEEYKYAECKKVSDLQALGFNMNTDVIFDKNVMCLENGDSMFSLSKKVQSFDTEVPFLESAQSMFNQSPLAYFKPKRLNYVKNMYTAFQHSNIESFCVGLPVCTNCGAMFSNAMKLKTLILDAPLCTNFGWVIMGAGSLQYVEIKGITSPTLVKSLVQQLPWCNKEDGYIVRYDTGNEESNKELSKWCTLKNWIACCNENETYSEFIGDERMFYEQITSLSGMFQNSKKLRYLKYDLPNLKDGWCFFQGCSSLVKYTSPSNYLTGGWQMFGDCTSLVSFESDLPALSNGGALFQNCRLDKTSVLRILNSIPAYTDGASHPLTLGCTKDSRTVDGVTYEGCYKNGVVDPDITEALNNAKNKGWTVAISYNT